MARQWKMNESYGRGVIKLMRTHRIKNKCRRRAVNSWMALAERFLG